MNHDLNRLFGELLTGEPAKGQIEKNAAGILPEAFENRLIKNNDSVAEFPLTPNFHRDAAHWEETLGILEGTRQTYTDGRRLDKSGPLTVLSETPEVFVKIGAQPELPVVINFSTLKRKIMAAEDMAGHGHGHGLTSKELAQIPQSLVNPVAIMRPLSGARAPSPNSVVAITLIKDSKGRHVITALDIAQESGKAQIIRSIYGKKAVDEFIKRGRSEDAFLYKNETALRELEAPTGLQWPTGTSSHEEPLSESRIATPRDVVKGTGAEYAISPNEVPDAEYSIAGGAEAPKSEQSSPIEASYNATTGETPDLVKLIREGKYNLRDEGGMTPDHVPTQGEQLTRIRDITKRLEKIAPLRTGSKLGPNTLGYYQPIADVARTRAKNDIDTALHEIGHAIDHKLDLRGRSGLAGRQIRQELAALGKETSPKNSAEQYLVNEGIAEFFRINAQNSEQAAKAAPLYARELSQALSEPGAAHIRETVEDLTRAVRDYYGQSATARERANRLTGDDAPRKTLKERVEGWGMDFRRQWDDRLAPLEMVTNEIKFQFARPCRARLD